MIASGLCTMGGCFAQDADGAAVETYWHAAEVQMGMQQATALYSKKIAGGDSETDFFHLKGSYDFTAVNDWRNWKILLGAHASEISSNSWNSDGFWIRSSESRNAAGVLYGTTSWYRYSGAARFELIAKEGTCDSRFDDDEWEHFDGAYTVRNPRAFQVYPNYLKCFSFALYRNKNTRTFQAVHPMLSVSGSQALWEIHDQSLIEF